MVLQCFDLLCALTLSVGWQEGHPACKNWNGEVQYWHSYLSGVRCK